MIPPLWNLFWFGFNYWVYLTNDNGFRYVNLLAAAIFAILYLWEELIEYHVSLWIKDRLK